jgi:hypothetical protein
MQDARPLNTPRNLTLNHFIDYNSNVQFAGDPKDLTHYPPLFNRDVLAFFPFQVTDTRFVIPVYVMTRNVNKVYGPDAPSTDPTRFDLPPEKYDLAIGGINGAIATATATDPMTGTDVPVEIKARSADELVISLPVTDSPRLLTIQEEAQQFTSSGFHDPRDSESSIPSRSIARLRVRGGRALLRTQRLRAQVQCDTPCSLRIRGRLKVGSRTFPMKTSSDATSSAASTTVMLGISRQIVKAARQARRRGLPISATVTVHGSSESPGAVTERRVIVFSR